MYFEVCSKVTTPAPVNLRQTPKCTPTPLSRFVPQVRVVSVFLWRFWHIWGGGGQVGAVSNWGLGWSRRRVLEGGAESQIRGGVGVIDDDD